jgi:hypothetical protein
MEPAAHEYDAGQVNVIADGMKGGVDGMNAAGGGMNTAYGVRRPQEGVSKGSASLRE